MSDVGYYDVAELLFFGRSVYYPWERFLMSDPLCRYRVDLVCDIDSTQLYPFGNLRDKAYFYYVLCFMEEMKFDGS
jgi:hypothetical protein